MGALPVTAEHLSRGGEGAFLTTLLAAIGAAAYATGLPLFKSVLLCILALVVMLFTNPYQRWRHRHIPGPPYRPLVGNLPEFITIGSPAFFNHCRDRFGPVFVVWFGSRPWVVVAEAELGRRVNYRLLNRPRAFTNPLARGEALKYTTEGLFLARDALWSRLRRVWQPAFHSDSLAGYAPVMATETRHLVTRLGAAARAGDVIDIWRDIGRMTMSVVGSTAYGVDFALLSGDADAAADGADGAAAAADAALPVSPAQGTTLVTAAAQMFQASEVSNMTRYLVACHLMPVMVPLISLIAAAFPDERYRRLIGAREALRACSQALIDATRGAAAAAAGGSPRAASPSCSDGAGRRPVGVAPGSFLGLLLSDRDAEGHGLTDSQMAAQANVFTLAGYETTANTLAYCVWCLSANPDAQARLLAEVDALGGQEGREVTVEDLAQLPYTAAVVDEALRLFPPGASTMREARGGFGVGGYTVPDGTAVMVATYSIQRDPAVWPKADEFLPDRWLPGHEDLAAASPHAYLPFGSGARMCVGHRFALQEARLTLAQLYRHFTFELAPGQVPLRVRTGITMSPADGVQVRVVPRRVPAAAA